jgi:hypothetical protein
MMNAHEDKQRPDWMLPKQFYEKPLFCIIMLVVLFPVGLILLWTYKPFPKRLRILLTIGVAIVVIVIASTTEKSVNTDTPGVSIGESVESELDSKTHENRSNDLNTGKIAETNSTESIQKGTSNISIPADEIGFIKVIEDAYSQYKSAGNDLEKSSIRTSRGKSIEAVLSGDYSIVGWLGQIESMKTNREGDANISVGLLKSTATLESSSWDDKTLIKHNSRLYNTIAKMSEGDTVVFAGIFLPSDKFSFVKEKSISEYGSMSSPEFSFQFISIDKISLNRLPVIK